MFTSSAQSAEASFSERWLFRQNLGLCIQEKSKNSEKVSPLGQNRRNFVLILVFTGILHHIFTISDFHKQMLTL